MSWTFSTRRWSRASEGGLLARLWRGECGLAVSWWGFGVTVSLAYGALLIAVPPPVSGMLALAFLPYDVVWMVGTWRAAQSYAGLGVWPLAVCVFIVLNWIGWVPVALWSLWLIGSG